MSRSDVLLDVQGLKTHFTTDDGVVRAVDGMDLSISRGRTTCLVGESGCGKSITARSILQLIDPPGRIAAGRIWWHGGEETAEPTDLAALDPRGARMRAMRGADISMIFQEPMAAFSPMYTVGDHLVEAIQLHLPLSRKDATEKAVHLLGRVGIPRPDQRMHAYPFQLSGGMCQRVMIAMALACEPSLLIADEPTTALDVTTQARILDLLTELQDDTGMAMLFITHDLGVVAEIADDVSVMYLGTVVEEGSVTDVFDSPRHPYTQALIASVPRMGSRGDRARRLAAIEGIVPHPLQRPAGCPFHTRCHALIGDVCHERLPDLHSVDGGQLARCHLYDESVVDPGAGRAQLPLLPAAPVVTGDRPQPAPEDDRAPVLEVRDLTMHYPVKRGLLNRTVGHVRAVDGVSLAIQPGETLGLVGESGCGKTTLGRAIVRAIAPTSGQITYRGDNGAVDLAGLPDSELRGYRGQIRMIFQDPFSSLNPRMTLLQLLAEPFRNPALRRDRIDSEMEQRVADMLARVGLRPEYMRRYPHAFSGGQRQRVNIARALITTPRLVVADEAVSALDVSVRAQILNLLADLRDEYHLTYLFISHDLSVVEHLCDRVAVMYLGKIVETTTTAQLFDTPRHPYTEALLSAVPVADPHRRANRRGTRLSDDLPDPSAAPPGCSFHTRCPYVRADRCGTEVPLLRGVGTDHAVACHHAEALTLRGTTSTISTPN
ncbi:ABC transporter ATP-binding protein [Jiangella asiatica]|uniref:ABC transporter ATP-binding protein n=1 Tax=Jiangella asiatica TaxID=2530372 RepID=UPI00193E78C3|nr:ABC transporter ATP-binding protein [Jiangella asiatica]